MSQADFDKWADRNVKLSGCALIGAAIPVVLMIIAFLIVLGAIVWFMFG